jgi:two-component system, NtrC family, sensor histidine kinase HydH
MGDDLKKALASLPREIRVLLAEVPAAMAYVDRDQRIRFANERFEAWTVAQFPDGVAGRSVAEVSGDRYEVHVRPNVERVLEGRPSMHEAPLQGPDGQPHWIRTIVLPDIEDGEVRGYVLMTTDITHSRLAEHTLERERQEHATRLEDTVAERTAQLRELQQRLVDAERLSAAEEMAGAVAHAINNPLTALLGTVEMAQQSMIGQGAALERIRLLAKRIEEVVQGTLWMYRQGKVNLCPESPESLVDWVKDDLAIRARARRVEIIAKVEPGLPLVFADRTLLGSALGCIAENALQASPEHGRVWIEAEQMHEGRVVRIRIADEGPGIPQVLRAKVLEPFFTTKSGGTGFGLAIASAVIQGHGGSLRIGDRPGGGTSVEIELLTSQGGARPSTALRPDPRRS